ncbi:hypothetical protein PybrP1_004972 [[Pythium] brassicae (nom. inval.)]|nr:hypothetical protein PybrP1_004972 [[Pythium] brassicae (nom. inval.)]
MCSACPRGYACSRADQSPQACAPGTYSEANSTICSPCPPGFSCADPSELPVPCAVGTYASTQRSLSCSPCPAGRSCTNGATLALCLLGTYSSEGDSECRPCPKGYQCQVTTAPPVRCAAGTFAPVGSAKCFDCLAGQYCPDPSMDPIACPRWHYSDASSTSCTPCPAGHDCTVATASPPLCPVGMFNLQAGAPCTICPTGAACRNATSLPENCAPGMFSIGGQTQCTLCAPGFYCPYTNQNTQIACADGTYAESGSAKCTACPIGKQCPSTTQHIEQSCPQGTFSLGGQSQCTSCPRGYKCPQTDGSKNAPCALGSFSAGSAISCTTCPAGYACPDPASDIPIPCLPGSYSVGGASTCTPCPPGYACPDTTSSQRIQCSAGSYAIGGDATCTPCPAGYQCLLTNSSSFQPCTQGWYSPAGSSGCIQCPRGYFCDVLGEMPKNCTVGSYSLNGSTSCIACDPGYECPRSDQLPQPCPVGYYSEGGVANCKPCKPGYKCGLASTSPTPPKDECPMGGYCNPTTTFFLCPAGTFGNVTGGEVRSHRWVGMSVDHACAVCPEGSYCEMGSAPLTKQPCPPGFFCPEATKRASQYPCPSGTFSPLPSQKTRDACRICPAGFFCEQGSPEPESCPQGYYCREATGSANQYPCPAGTFSGPKTGLTDASQCQQCQIGSYCPEASSSPIQCPAGTYNPTVGSAGEHECLSCPPGWSCPRVGQRSVEDRCAPGHYCPSKTILATAKPCPAGTYTERFDLIRAEDCTICPLRHACPEGTGSEVQTMLGCAPGFFCPNGTARANQFPCPPGSWSSSTSLADATECDVCPKGKYCVGGKSFVDGSCSPGYYCPLGTESPTKFPCPSGTYTSKTWLFEPSQCDDCPPGFYCPAGSVEPIACKPGSYTPLNKTERVGPESAWPSCVTCPAGYFCVEASIVPEPCGKGRFSSAGSKACSPCEPGFFCGSASTSYASMKADTVGWTSPGALYGKCYNGTYCPPGSASEPALAVDACPAGYYCPTATPQPMICPAGTYSNFTGQDAIDDCAPTPAGYFSIEGALAPTGECSPGYYCPLRSTSRTQVPCPARYYLNRTGGRSEDDCALCSSGSYCPKGSAYPVQCPPGSYCRTGIAAPEPCPIGTYANSSGLRQVEDCVMCAPGMYCDSTGLTLPRGLCDPGYYCTLGAYTSAPMNYESTIFGVSNKHTGAQCPQGAYCPLGSATPTLCPPGTFNNFTGLETETQCVSCPPGRYCETPGLFLSTGNCFAGYYCTGGSRNATQFASPPGFFSLTGASVPTPCPLGQFNLHPTQERCVDCPAGFYCGSSATVQPLVCPTGTYCPKSSALPLKCSPGTFSSVEGLVAENQCEGCPAGYFCDSYGLPAPSGKCFEGFVCTHSSPVANPVGQPFGFICPAGHYCPEGSGAGVQCPNGTFRASVGGTSSSSCAPCPGGFYCEGTALTAPTDKCGKGYFCVSRASSATPTDDITGGICPRGFFCESGTIDPVRCAAGTYALEAGQTSCSPCPAGFFCDGLATDRVLDCPTGRYCPIGTAAIPLPCPSGTFSKRTRLVNASECAACTPGFYCGGVALDAVSGACSPGFYCPAASEDKFGRTVVNDTHPCSAGAYCPEGTYLPIPCPRGTYSNATALTSAKECTLCDEGSYCADPGLTSPTGLCAAGHYCKRNNTLPNPSTGVTSPTGNVASAVLFGGDRCPVGSYCCAGSASPRQCPEGTYADEPGASVCKACAPGYFCPLGTAVYSTNKCPQGYYCPEGTKRSTEYPCSPGTFGDAAGLQRGSQCSPAPGGMYIDTFAAVKPTGVCKSGFYCSGGSVSSTPSLGITGGPCLPGTNCPEGSAVPIVCDAGYYCSSTNTDKALPCDEGFYCVQGSYTANPTGQNNSLGIIGDVCTSGHYCPKGSSNPIPCPPGTYSGNTQNVDPEDCFPCPPGYLCPSSGTTLPSMKCPSGFICIGGEREASQQCPKGSECPEGSSYARACSAGSFSDEVGLAQCKLCPERHFCAKETVRPQECPPGFYCPLRTPSATSYPCPPGTYSNWTSLASAAECALCPPGKFCSGEPPTTAPTGECAPGYYCAGRANTSQPTDGATGGRCAGGFMCFGGAWQSMPIDNRTGRACDAGYYCPDGSSSQIRCPKGTYNSFEKQTSCTTCPAGGYCNTNATAPAPCPPRYFCPRGTLEPVVCPNGTFGHQIGLESANQCAACSAGKYCTGGVLTASCAAGYYCKMFNDDPNPAFQTNTSKFDYGGPCPIGHYCPEGVLDPFPCPNFTARLETHGSSVGDCGLCPAGMSCEDGAMTIPCPRGSYCLYGKRALPCPEGTYNPSEGKRVLEDCIPCAAGKLCNRTGIVDPTDYNCPPGHYCLAAESFPRQCPIGRFRRGAGGRSADDCQLCVGGSYCALGSIEPTVCESKVYCPVGAGLPISCPGGSYCQFNSSRPTLCPEGYYCLPPSDLPIACDQGYYCPAGAAVQLPCPLGYIGRATPLSGAYTTLTDACESCPPGTFGSDPKRLRCETCSEGFVCLGATTSSRPISRELEKGYECPPGFYCQAGSSRELACPIGTYQSGSGATNVTFCRECPSNSYQNFAGQSSCLPCSKSAYSSAGATKCTCIGSHRAFQMTDGYCICEPGYEFYDQDLILRSDEDDDVDCQPIVYDRCGSNQVRSESGSCVFTTKVSCESTCNNGTGTYVSSLGLCQCDQQPDLDIVCDEACRASSLQLQVNSVTGKLQLYDPATDQVEAIESSDASRGIVAKVSCATSTCQLHVISIDVAGFSGSYGIPASLPVSTSSEGSRRRRLSSNAEQSIPNPMLCVTVGSGIMFDLSAPDSYPIYLKDSMLNTNPSFDYGAFRSLATKVKSNSSSVSAFAFTFSEPGMYVFGNSLNSAAKTVVAVMSDGTTCPTDGAIVSLNEKNLIAVSAKRRTDDLILAPDWGLIAGLLGGLFGMVAAIIGGLYYFRTKSWTNSSLGRKITGYRAKSRRADLTAVHSKGSVVASKTTGAGDSVESAQKPMAHDADDASRPKITSDDGYGAYKADLERWDDEDLDVRELVDRLQHHHESVEKCFEEQRGDAKQLAKHLQAEAAELKRLFVSALLSPSSLTPSSLDDFTNPEVATEPSDALFAAAMLRDSTQGEVKDLQRNSRLLENTEQLSKGTAKVSETASNEGNRLGKCEQADQDAATELTTALSAPKAQIGVLKAQDSEQRADDARGRRAAQIGQTQQRRGEQDAKSKPRDEAIFEIKNLLVALTTQLNARQSAVGIGSTPAGDQTSPPPSQACADISGDRQCSPQCSVPSRSVGEKSRSRSLEAGRKPGAYGDAVPHKAASGLSPSTSGRERALAGRVRVRSAADDVCSECRDYEEPGGHERTGGQSSAGPEEA